MNKQALKEVLGVQTSTHKQFRMFAYIVRQVKKIPNCKMYVNNGNLYVTKGIYKSYPCVVAHMDTVHAIETDLTVIEIGDNLTAFNKHTMRQTGIGGDDKVGIFIALECLKEFETIKLAFFRDEEIGCAGSRLADVSFFDDVNFVLQCDRKGFSDFVNSASGVKLSSKAFTKEIKQTLKSHFYSITSGMMTDVMALKELGIDCCMANMSCGYFNPHSEREYVSMFGVENCLSMVTEIIRLHGWKRFIQKYEKSKYVHYDADYREGTKWNAETKRWEWEKEKEPKQGKLSYPVKNSLQDETDKALARIQNSNRVNFNYDYCGDCGRPGANANGLCQDCFDHYKNNYGIDASKVIPTNRKPVIDTLPDADFSENPFY